MIPNITESQKQQLADDGYFLLENVFTISEMEALAERIESYQKNHEKELVKLGGSEGISQAGEITFTGFLAEHDEDIRKFCERPEFVAISTQLLGPDVDLYWNQSVFKEPEGEKEFPWHQDDGYTAVTPSPYLTLWLALNDATPENGCISVIPGSHKQGLVPHKQSPMGLYCHEADDPDQGVQIPVKAGSMGVFWSLTFHKSGVNRSTGSRKAYIIQYSQAGLRRQDNDALIENRIPIARDGKAALVTA